MLAGQENKFDEASAATRAALLQQWMNSGALTLKELTEAMGHWNVAMGAGSTTSKGWMSSVRRLGTWDDAVYRARLAECLGRRLS